MKKIKTLNVMTIITMFDMRHIGGFLKYYLICFVFNWIDLWNINVFLFERWKFKPHFIFEKQKLNITLQIYMIKWNGIKWKLLKLNPLKGMKSKQSKSNQNVLQKTWLPDMSFRDKLLSTQMNHTGLPPQQLQSSWPQQQKRTKILHLY